MPIITYANNGCTGSSYKTSFTNELINLIDYTEIKMNTKSYASGDIRCGGVLMATSYSSYTVLGSFNRGALHRCDNDSLYGESGYGFSQEKNQADLEFKYTPTKVNNIVAGLTTACSYGTSYLKINSIMLR